MTSTTMPTTTCRTGNESRFAVITVRTGVADGGASVWAGRDGCAVDVDAGDGDGVDTFGPAPIVKVAQAFAAYWLLLFG
jgi:hypothetical protein